MHQPTNETDDSTPRKHKFVVVYYNQHGDVVSMWYAKAVDRDAAERLCEEKSPDTATHFLVDYIH